MVGHGSARHAVNATGLVSNRTSFRAGGLAPQHRLCVCVSKGQGVAHRRGVCAASSESWPGGRASPSPSCIVLYCPLLSSAVLLVSAQLHAVEDKNRGWMLDDWMIG